MLGLRMMLGSTSVALATNGRVLLPEGNGWMKQIEENKMVKPTGIQNYVTRSKTWRAVKMKH